MGSPDDPAAASTEAASPRARKAGFPKLAAAVLLGVALIYHGLLGGAPPQPTSAEALAAHPDWADAPPAAPLPASAPLRIRIPAISVDAPLTGLHLDRQHHLLPPPDEQRNLAGWYTGGAAPGTVGAAIIAGHVDNAHGPAVFYGLGSLHRGDTVSILRRDRRTATFRVDGIDVYSRKSFPDRKVYGPTPYPELRLITCGGGYTRASGYLGNVVVFAHLVTAASP
ncbi:MULTISPECIES: class F sortase [Streptacidiphilus]|uniref:Class F sortase n=2 Tax=Streptacidiphilus TaxID=228398 RepID=A0ABV6UJW6_9ACTN|nr:class F sortase [Streptacidiphilus jeojiense]